MAVRLGELLLRENASRLPRSGGAEPSAPAWRAWAAVSSLRILHDEDITSVLSRQCGMPAISLKSSISIRRSCA
jgi:hypothetical protein